MEYIFLDTSIFVSENFLDGKRIKSILEFVESGKVKLIVPQLTYDEITKKIGDGIKASFQKIKILKNYQPMKDIMDEKAISEHIKEKLQEELKKTNVEIIGYPQDSDIIKKVFDDYFKGEPPFGKEKKKHEFLDAFALNILENYANSKKIKIIVFAEDKDFSGFNSSGLDIRKLEDFKKFINDKIEERT